MRLRRHGGVDLRFSQTSLISMRRYVQRGGRSLEAGGVLLGRILIGTNDVVVDEVTVPGPHDRRSRFGFVRAERPAQEAVNLAWTRSAGELNYLGEWHTHPEDDPTPSRHDYSDWQRLVATQRYEQESLFFVIVGRQWIRAWELARGQAVPAPLSSVSDASGDPERGTVAQG